MRKITESEILKVISQMMPQKHKHYFASDTYGTSPKAIHASDTPTKPQKLKVLLSSIVLALHVQSPETISNST